MRISVIIPTRNEAQALQHVLADIPAGLVSEVLLRELRISLNLPDL